jgi:hypothetical protein
MLARVLIPLCVHCDSFLFLGTTTKWFQSTLFFGERIFVCVCVCGNVVVVLLIVFLVLINE